MSRDEDDLIEIGHIIGVHGVKGQVKVFSHTSPRENILNYSPWVIEQAGVHRTTQVKGSRQGKNVIAAVEDVADRDSAMKLAGAKILIRRSQLPVLAKDEYYWSQLIGLQVLSVEGEEFGRVDQMMETGANDVMVVQGDRERLIPYVMHDVIKSVDLDRQQILVDWEPDF